MTANYSVVMYYDDFEKVPVKKIELLLERGTLVYLFVTDQTIIGSKNTKKPIEFDSSVISKALEYRFLQIFLVEEYYNYNGKIAIDGQEHHEIFNYILEDTDYLYNNAEADYKGSVFNLDQYHLVHARPDENMIVRASAGTGKTTCMVDRIMFLKHTNTEMNLKDIAMITFTNKATVEMRIKIFDRLSEYYKTYGVRYQIPDMLQ